ncbi:hypothetical protein MOE00_20315 [Bacillus inaquosorum]|uniref:Uncharacterized protein n=1 Tax=Bacillus inaquosorum TaxID=483913 RepID=A0A9Q4I087_9BACI|nr:hypothetical protein [Bacillus inaquosorum]MCY7788505.1 hypothetical protein [Bacillus inaquosorum]MCY7819871.1 hypothetical protein [Bacillus inaquosorum]MCY7939950.1 hypothetical protein [Bacillus inaquosorum]MCY7943718.1 hypothetical protein [Bacillus inaquosorum]MCY7982372.1 hypothetical protein [Bacillus inaquosorum]
MSANKLYQSEVVYKEICDSKIVAKLGVAYRKKDINPACRENDVFSTSFFVSLDAYCILDTEKGSHISIPAWIGMWQSSSCSGMRL